MNYEPTLAVGSAVHSRIPVGAISATKRGSLRSASYVGSHASPFQSGSASWRVTLLPIHTSAESVCPNASSACAMSSAETRPAL